MKRYHLFTSLFLFSILNLNAQDKDKKCVQSQHKDEWNRDAQYLAPSDKLELGMGKLIHLGVGQHEGQPTYRRKSGQCGDKRVDVESGDQQSVD